jgi:hypothetical protein
VGQRAEPRPANEEAAVTLRELFMRPATEPLAFEQLSPPADQGEQLGPAAANPPAADPPPDPAPGTPAEGVAASPPTSRSVPACCSADRPSPPERLDSPVVAALAANHGRLAAELDAVRSSLPGLAEAVQQARDLARERNIASKVEPGEETARLAREARDLYARAAEAEAVAVQEADTLAVAFARVAKELEIAVAAAQREDERRVREVVLEPATMARVKTQLREALDWLHLASKLQGAGTGNVMALVGEALGQQGGLSGEALWNRSITLFDRLLAGAKRKAVSP